MKMYSILLPVLLLGIGCAHSVQYKLTDKDRWPGTPAPKSVAVATFTDGTSPEKAKDFQEGAYTWRVNHRERYVDKEIANGVSDMLAEHLRYSGWFQQVMRGAEASGADYELTGTVARYYAKGRVNKGAETAVITGAVVGSLAGVGITMAATAGQKTEIHADVELRDVALRDRASGVVLWKDTISVSTNFTAHWMQADSDNIYRHPDDCLKQAVSELIRRTRQVLQAPPEVPR